MQTIGFRLVTSDSFKQPPSCCWVDDDGSAALLARAAFRVRLILSVSTLNGPMQPILSPEGVKLWLPEKQNKRGLRFS